MQCQPAPPPIAADPIAPLLAPLASLHGIGPAAAGLIERAADGGLVRDLLFHMPDGFTDRRARPTIRAALPGSIATLDVEVVRHEAPANSRQPWRIVVTDGSGFLEIVLFGRAGRDRFAPGARLLVSGRLELFNGRLTLPHPDHVVPAATPELLPAIEPVWPLTAGLSPKVLGRAMRTALEGLSDFPEWADAALVRREGWPGFAAALRAVQAPDAPPGEAPRRRLAYDELLAQQVAIAWARARERERPGRALAGDGALREAALARFGHALTPGQAAVLAEIDADLAAPRRMLRLLQGDVGSGKTLVATLAMLRAAEAGAQAALMAPTELLSRQHHRTLTRICPLPVALLTGGVKGGPRDRLLARIAAGDVSLVVGTHALFQEGVAYRDLALAVIDEQHRFGVDQRMMLGAKGARTDILVMTATPIPRTLLLTHWAEMEVSRLADRPGARPPVRTTLHALGTLPDIADAIARALADGGQVYWVCPLVSESETLDVAAAEERFSDLRRRFGSVVGLAHGRQDSAVRQSALADFAAGRVRILVATTVVEVGVDVPSANVMVIEHAERFGLAQLHQLRG
ncbi:MAG TPA: ATP-dependent DNA helicase RecG, partial [Acetobacteraceae bacterium]|nr:ATP-dependent DNA helicase RecG [Acetobacteraceae bacterium]